MEYTLYVMASRTQTGVGRLIRTVCRYPYNHVSLSLDPQLRDWVSFARRNQDTPLYGGFIRESPQRYLAQGQDPLVRIYAVPVSRDRYRRLELLFARAGQTEGLLYNLFDAVAGAFGRHIRLPGAYTCLSFANRVLGTHYRSIQALCLDLQEKMIYEGKLKNLVSDNGCRDEEYFRRLGYWRGTWRSARHFAVLSARAFRPDAPDPVTGLESD